MSNSVQATREEVTAEAPAGIGNLAVGFDLLGQALAAPCDRVTLKVREGSGIEITDVTGVVRELPVDPRRNAATAGVVRMLDDQGAKSGLDVAIHKGIAMGSGMGGSAASAVAGVLAADALFGLALSTSRLLEYALDGEEAATGARHADNVASALCGGVTLVTHRQAGISVQQLPVPPGIFSVLVHPHLVLETRASRAALPTDFPRDVVIRQSANLAGFVVACFNNDMALLRDCLRDVLIEPHRARLITGFDSVKAAALQEGALGCSVSGGGPSVFAWCDGEDGAQRAGKAMSKAFADAGIAADTFVSPASAPGARIAG
ncbi:MAG: homoserine kinase [Gammaproteobacteria bacterium]|nr:homoserine kinase [Gammaproteobacteria bacterium]